MDTSVGLKKLAERLEEQFYNNEVTVKVLDSLTKKIDELSGNLSTIQADFQRWKTLEVQYNAENMEEDMTYVGNTTVLVTTSITPPTSTPSFVFGETDEIQPAQPTMSQTVPVLTMFPPSFIDPATRLKMEYSDFSPSFFTAPKVEEAQEFTNTGIPIVLSDSETPTGSPSLPPGAQEAISEIWD